MRPARGVQVREVFQLNAALNRKVQEPTKIDNGRRPCRQAAPAVPDALKRLLAAVPSPVTPAAAAPALTQDTRRFERPLFCGVTLGGSVTRTPMSEKIVNRSLKQACRLAGLEAERFSGHSARRGLLTDAGHRQMPLVDDAPVAAHIRRDRAELSRGRRCRAQQHHRAGRAGLQNGTEFYNDLP